MKSRQKGIVSLVLMVVLALVLVFSSDSIYDALKQQSQTTAGSTEGTAIETSAAGFGGDVVVSTVIGDDGSIAGVSIVDCSTETDTIGQVAAPEIAKAIVEAQSLDVDGVAGATVTSDAVKSAVEAALTEAGVDAAAFRSKSDDEAPEEAAEEISETAEEASETAGETAEEAAEEISETAEETAEEVSETDMESGEASETTTDDIAVPAGEYEASAPGYGGDVKISVIMNEDGSVGAVKILDMSSETPDIGQEAAPEVAKQIVLAQSADVDGVSGATVTSNAVIEAAALVFTGSGSPAESADEALSEETTEETADAAEETTEVTDGADENEGADASAVIVVPAGEYEASAPGSNGDVKVGVVITADGSIAAVKILDMAGETSDEEQAAALEMAKTIVTDQTAEAVSSSNPTGDAVAAAVAMVLAGEGTPVQ
ncbi:MAG: FMN-binding protein [Eubacteriales bacterium]|nr:FMN-binding protein [Eubacteriales bacterium]